MAERILVPAERVPVRRDFFLSIYETCSQHLPDFFNGSSFDGDDATYLAGLYFLMNDAYKRFRMKNDHFTNDDKKAGLTIAAVMALRPIQIPPRPENERQRFYVHQVFGLACAEGILDRPLLEMPTEDKLAFFNFLDTLRFPSTVAYVVDAAAGASVLSDNFLLRISFPELSQIDLIVQMLKKSVG